MTGVFADQDPRSARGGGRAPARELSTLRRADRAGCDAGLGPSRAMGDDGRSTRARRAPALDFPSSGRAHCRCAVGGSNQPRVHDRGRRWERSGTSACRAPGSTARAGSRGPPGMWGRARPGLLHARIVACPYAHARIAGIDKRAAEALPGVVRSSRPTTCRSRDGDDRRFEPLARREAVFAGQPVALVVARTETIAKDAGAWSSWTSSRSGRWSTSGPRRRATRHWHASSSRDPTTPATCSTGVGSG